MNYSYLYSYTIISYFPEKGAVATFFGKTLEYLRDLFFPPQANSEKHFLGKPGVLLQRNSIILKYNAFQTHLLFRKKNTDNLQLVSGLQF